MTIPPPTPSTPRRNPADESDAHQGEGSARHGRYCKARGSQPGPLGDAASGGPAARGAVVCDIDGTLAPIVAMPDEARVLPEALAALERLTRALRARGLRDRPAGGRGA